MRGTVAKRLRRKSRSEGVPWAIYRRNEMVRTTIELHPACDKAKYRKLKKEYVHG